MQSGGEKSGETNGGGVPSMFDMLRWMDDAAIRDFERLVRRRTFAPGQVIYTQQEAGSEMYRVVSGAIRLTARRADGREAVFLMFGAGDCFGVSSLVDHEARPQTAECLTQVKLDVLSASGFEELLKRHDSFGRAVMILLARQMRVVSQYYELHSLTSLASRIAARLLEVAVESRTDRGSGGTLVAELPQAELAAMVGTSRQSVNKILQAFQREGMISVSKGAIAIRDKQALRQRADSTSS